MTLKFKRVVDEENWTPPVEEEEQATLFPPAPLRLLLNRAVWLYVSLFFCLSVLLSLLGLDPLIHNGLMPKALLLYVGLAMLLAWGSMQVQRLDEPSPGWLVRIGKWRL